MSKFSRFVVVGVVALMAIAGATMAFAQEAVPTLETARAFVQEDGSRDVARNGRRGGGELRELASQVFDRDAAKAVVADALGLEVADLEAAKEAGTKLSELAEAQGVEMETVRAAVQAYRETAVAEAIAAGTITEEQGEQLLSHEGRRGKHGRRGERLGRLVDRGAVATAVADTLGISVEDLQAAKEAGTSMEELAAENGVAIEDIRAAVEAVKTAAVEQAVEDGIITQEQADQILSGEGKFGRRGFGQRDGRFGEPQNNTPAGGSEA